MRKVERSPLKASTRDRRVAEIFECELVEIVAADVDVEVLAPIVLHALDTRSLRPAVNSLMR